MGASWPRARRVSQQRCAASPPPTIRSPGVMAGQRAARPAKHRPARVESLGKGLPRRSARIRLALTVAGQSQLSTRTIVRVFFTLVALGVLLYTLYLVRSVLGLLMIAVFLAVALGPAVDRIKRLKLPRAASIIAVFLGLFLGDLPDRPDRRAADRRRGRGVRQGRPQLHRRHPLERHAARVRRQVRHHEEARGPGLEPPEPARGRRGRAAGRHGRRVLDRSCSSSPS